MSDDQLQKQVPITPQLLARITQERADQLHEGIVDGLAKWLPEVLTYDKVLESMLRGDMLFDLRFKQEPCDLAAIMELAEPKLRPYLDTLVDPAHFRWRLESIPEGAYEAYRLRFIPLIQ